MPNGGGDQRVEKDALNPVNHRGVTGWEQRVRDRGKRMVGPIGRKSKRSTEEAWKKE